MIIVWFALLIILKQLGTAINTPAQMEHDVENSSMSSLQYRDNGRNGVSNHQPHHCLLNRLFGRRSKKTSKLRVTGLCTGNSPVSGEFPVQMHSNTENISIWWHYYDDVMIIASLKITLENWQQDDICTGNFCIEIYRMAMAHTFPSFVLNDLLKTMFSFRRMKAGTVISDLVPTEPSS